MQVSAVAERFAVGGVPEHFNIPWYRAAEREVFASEDLTYQWTSYPGGTGAMLAALDSGELDMAVLLTEGVVAHIAAGGDAAILGTYVDSPLVWGVHVHDDSPFTTVDDLQGRTFGISRPRSGSHLMSFVLARQQGWSPTEDIKLAMVRNLEGAREALAAGEAEAFLWEKYTTKPLVDAGEWRRVGECKTPWPPFVMASRRGFAQKRRAHIKLVVDRVKSLVDEVAADEEATVADIHARFGQRREDVREWLAQTHWACQLSVDLDELQGVIDILGEVGVIDEPLSPESLVL